MEKNEANGYYGGYYVPIWSTATTADRNGFTVAWMWRTDYEWSPLMEESKQKDRTARAGSVDGPCAITPLPAWSFLMCASVSLSVAVCAAVCFEPIVCLLRKSYG